MPFIHILYLMAVSSSTAVPNRFDSPSYRALDQIDKILQTTYSKHFVNFRRLDKKLPS
ncbi:hypothetical protein THIOM_002140 [Candidatus Thiomargarita nelsonii]|uniref:Uncharacterized protein n=1 Tax=Candidatus Thiomargarita nelsonii TaxID=1003181 RepID=A0A176S2B5_9GAMM|nr:hypothetical protein THIOM_002140 [Candidatus Thiomargarita nelsonii]